MDVIATVHAGFKRSTYETSQANIFGFIKLRVAAVAQG